MDPNETLRMLRRWSSGSDAITDEEARSLFDDLDEWLYKGGFMPDNWAVRTRKVEDNG